jgi:hypothetical protein
VAYAAKRTDWPVYAQQFLVALSTIAGRSALAVGIQRQSQDADEEIHSICISETTRLWRLLVFETATCYSSQTRCERIGCRRLLGVSLLNIAKEVRVLPGETLLLRPWLSAAACAISRDKQCPTPSPGKQALYTSSFLQHWIFLATSCKPPASSYDAPPACALLIPRPCRTSYVSPGC